VQLSDFEFIKVPIYYSSLAKVLGRGSFGKVMLVSYKKNSELYAMKILRKDMIEKRNQTLHTKNERTILENVKHPFIVQLHFAF
jgi:serine/threonine protein kinase